MELIDRFGRKITYLRLSVTDQCNLRCVYCKPNGDHGGTGESCGLTYEELYRLAKIAVALGISKIRITGGEPLVWRDILNFVSKVTTIKGLVDVSITTNGVGLSNYLEQLYQSGIRRLNISLDTLKRERYRLITGVDRFQEVWEAIHYASRVGFHPIKINTVVIKDVNDDEIQEIAQLSRIYPFQIRFIEYMPIGHDRDNLQCVPLHDIKTVLKKAGRLFPVTHGLHEGPAERYRYVGACGEIGFISGMSRHACNKCNRLRLTSEGFLRPCLLTNIQSDIKGPLRRGATEDELAEIFIQAVKEKPKHHELKSDVPTFLPARMYAIGG